MLSFDTSSATARAHVRFGRGVMNLSASDLVKLLLRRWYVVVLGAVLSVGALSVTTGQPGVYYTQFNLVLLAPTEQYYPNKMEDPRHALAPLAGVIATDWNDTHPPLFTASGDTTLFGEGLRQGVQVRVPNQGSQWEPAYLTPNISVQVVDSAPETVAANAARITSELNTLLLSRQEAMGVRPTMRVTMLAAPEVPSVDYISGSRTRAALATGVVGAILTVIAVYWLERLLIRRRRPRLRVQADWSAMPRQAVNEPV